MDDANDIGTAQRALAECAYFLRAVHAEAALRGVSEAEIYSYVRTHDDLPPVPRPDIAVPAEELAEDPAEASPPPARGGARAKPAAAKGGNVPPKGAKGPPGRKLKREGTRLTFDIDESMPVGPQLRDALSKNAVRVIDLFRDWDDDQSGNVSKKEFRKAMGQLGFEAHRKEIDALFDSWDPDGSGSLELGARSRRDLPEIRRLADDAET